MDRLTNDCKISDKSVQVLAEEKKVASTKIAKLRPFRLLVLVVSVLSRPNTWIASLAKSFAGLWKRG